MHPTQAHPDMYITSPSIACLLPPSHPHFIPIPCKNPSSTSPVHLNELNPLSFIFYIKPFRNPFSTIISSSISTLHFSFNTLVTIFHHSYFHLSPLIPLLQYFIFCTHHLPSLHQSPLPFLFTSHSCLYINIFFILLHQSASAMPWASLSSQHVACG